MTVPVTVELNCSKVQERLTFASSGVRAFLLANDLKGHSLSSTESTVISPLAKERLSGVLLDCLVVTILNLASASSL